MDVHSPKVRSYNMSRIKGKDTKPERVLRKWIWKRGYRYRLHYKGLPGKPDIVFPGRRKVIFVHGCFWHKHDCNSFKWPATNSVFWRGKIEGNVERDFNNYKKLEGLEWQYLIVWECTINNQCKNEIIDQIVTFLSQP